MAFHYCYFLNRHVYTLFVKILLKAIFGTVNKHILPAIINK